MTTNESLTRITDVAPGAIVRYYVGTAPIVATVARIERHGAREVMVTWSGGKREPVSVDTWVEVIAPVRTAESARDAARRALSAAEDAAAGTYMGSDEWYAVSAAERTLSAAERTLSAAREALARAERAGDERAAADRYAREAEHDRFMHAVRPAIYGQR